MQEVPHGALMSPGGVAAATGEPLGGLICGVLEGTGAAAGSACGVLEGADPAAGPATWLVARFVGVGEVADLVALAAGVGWPTREASLVTRCCLSAADEAPGSEWVSSRPTTAATMIRAAGSAMIATLRCRWA